MHSLREIHASCAPTSTSPAHQGKCSSSFSPFPYNKKTATAVFLLYAAAAEGFHLFEIPCAFFWCGAGEVVEDSELFYLDATVPQNSVGEGAVARAAVEEKVKP